jgi:hypothetical protein
MGLPLPIDGERSASPKCTSASIANAGSAFARIRAFGEPLTMMRVSARTFRKGWAESRFPFLMVTRGVSGRVDQVSDRPTPDQLPVNRLSEQVLSGIDEDCNLRSIEWVAWRVLAGNRAEPCKRCLQTPISSRCQQTRKARRVQTPAWLPGWVCF